MSEEVLTADQLLRNVADRMRVLEARSKEVAAAKKAVTKCEREREKAQRAHEDALSALWAYAGGGDTFAPWEDDD